MTSPVPDGAAPAGFDPSDPVFVADPYPTYAAMRRTRSLRRSPTHGWWLASRHEHVDLLLRHRDLGRAFQPKQPYERFAPWNLVNAHAMLELEPPDHTRLRKLVSHAFTPRRVAALRGRIRDLADDLVDDLVEGGGDLVATVAEPLPVEVIAELLGIAPGDRGLLRPWSNAIVALYELDSDEAAADRAIRAAADFTAYLRELIAYRRTRPSEDLLSALVSLQLEGDRLSVNELVATAVLLLNAGHEASVNVIANGIVNLLTEPARYHRLVAEPQLVPLTVEEAIRFDTPLSLFTRTANADVVVDNVTIREGEIVGLLLGSANRDADVFDQPDVFDVSRSPNPHVGFGAGIHFCLGAALARVELQEAFASLVTRVPYLTLDGEPTRRDSYQFRGFSRVPVRVGTAV